MRKFGNVLWGLVFIAIGIIIGLNSMGITHINIFFRGWWTLFIIVPCFIGLFKNTSKWGDLIGLLIGIALLLCAQGIFSFSLITKLILPFILVVIGLSFLFRDFFNSKINEKMKALHKDGEKQYAATFGENKVEMQNEIFDGAELTAVFGSVELDLTRAIIQEDQAIHASAIFGGVEIRVPQNVYVKVKSTPIFGGVSNKSITIKAENTPTLYIDAFCMFGGVDIK